MNTCICAWLSCYYPLEWHTALLSVCANNTDDVRTYIKSIKDRGFKISPPDINKSDAEFIIKDDSIVFGLSAVKGVGAAVSKKIMSRKGKNGYKSFGHFIKRNVDILNSKILEFYTKAGCFSSFGYNKETILQNIPYILDLMGIIKNLDKISIFDIKGMNLEDYIENCIITKIDIDDSLQYEIEALGLYITDHPMESYIVNDFVAEEIKNIDLYYDGNTFDTVGAISGINIKKTKAKMNMCSFNLTTADHSVSCIMFPKIYSQYLASGKNIIKEGALVFVKGRIKEEPNGRTLIVNDISSDISKCLCPIIKKKEKIMFLKVNDLDRHHISADQIPLEITPNLRFILEKI